MRSPMELVLDNAVSINKDSTDIPEDLRKFEPGGLSQ